MERCGANPLPRNYRFTPNPHLLPVLGAVRLGDIGRERGAARQSRRPEAPFLSNQVVAMLSRLGNMAQQGGGAPEDGNPCRFIRKHTEPPRERFLSEEEFRRLGRVLGEVEAGGCGP